MSKVVVILGCIDGVLPASDRAAATLAVTRFGDDVDACSPHGDEAALRYVLGAGASRVMPLDKCSAAVYLVGRGGAAAEGDLMAARLATARGATLVLDVLDVEPVTNGLRVQRDLGRGAREVLTLTGPAVLVIADDAPRRMYVSRFRQITAAPPRANISPPRPVNWEPVKLRAKTADLKSKTSGTARDRMFSAFGLDDDSAVNDEHIIAGDAETCAEHLVRYLAHHGFVDRRFVPADAPRLAAVTSPGPTIELSSEPATVHARAPQPVNGPARGLHRRPRPYRPATGHLGKLARGPRPLGHAQPAHARGSRPIITTKDSTHG